MKKSTVHSLVQGSMTAALFAALTLLSATFGLAVGPFELRLSEALCILPVFFPSAIPGLFVGCIVGNLLSNCLPVDIIIGALATLLAALGTRLLRKKPALALLPPILANTIAVPPMLYWLYGFQEVAFPLLVLSIFVGEVLSAGVLGFLLYKALKPFEKRLM